MAQAKKGDKVKINYTGKLEDGTIFDSTIEADDCDTDNHSQDDCGSDECGCGCESGPVELTIGAEELFPQIDGLLVGMIPGEKKTVIISAEDSFGEYDEEKVFVVSRADLPDDLNPSVGDELVLYNEKDEELGVAVVGVSDESVTFDANHPLAGEDLTYEVELLEIL
jgi:peptidylprolyl isomerase